MHLRRSWLYVPASSEKMIRKAAGLGADVIIFDFEDSVAPNPEAKEEARAILASTLPALDFGRSEIMIRVNEVGGNFGPEDISRAARLRPSAVVLPKTHAAADVLRAEEILARAEGEAGAPPGRVNLAPMIESAAGVENAAAIAAAPRVTALLLGTADLARELGMRLTPEGRELDYVLMRVRMATGAAGADAVDAPTFAFRDMELLERQSRIAADMGYVGKSAVHPGQLEVIHRVFSPGPEEVEKARAVWAAWEKAQAEGAGVASLEGELVEKPFAERARRIIEAAEAIAAS